MTDKDRAAALFDGWEETLIWSALQGVMGRLEWNGDGSAGRITLGDYTPAEIALREADGTETGRTAPPATLEPGQTLESLYQERCPLYEQYADVTVDCDGKSLREVARQVYDRMQGRE